MRPSDTPLAVVGGPPHGGAGEPSRPPRERVLAALAAFGARAGDEGVPAVQDRLAALVAEAFGGHVVDLAVADARVARLVGASVPHGVVAAVLRRWRRSGEWRPEPAEGLVVVPLDDGGRLVGAVRLGMPRGAGAGVGGGVGGAGVRAGVGDEEVLALLGARVGAAVGRLVTDARRAEADAVAEVARHRDRVARALAQAMARHLDVALPALDDLASFVLPPEVALRAATARGAVGRAAAEAEQSAAVLDLYGGPRRGLVASLRGVVRDLAAASDADVGLHLTGRVRDVPPAGAEALLRVARAAAVSAVRHGRAEVVTVGLAFADDRVTVVVRDNGAAPQARADAGSVFGLRLMRRRLEELCGGLELDAARPTGAVVKAWVGA